MGVHDEYVLPALPPSCLQLRSKDEAVAATSGTKNIVSLFLPAKRSVRPFYIVDTLTDDGYDLGKYLVWCLVFWGKKLQNPWLRVDLGGPLLVAMMDDESHVDDLCTVYENVPEGM